MKAHALMIVLWQAGYLIANSNELAASLLVPRYILIQVIQMF